MYRLRMIPIVVVSLLAALVQAVGPTAASAQTTIVLARPWPVVRATAKVGEPVRFDWNSATDAYEYRIRIERDGGAFQDTTVTPSEFTRSFSQPGRYCLHVTSLPDPADPKFRASSESEPACVAVSEPVRTRLDRPTPTVDRPEAQVGQTVTFSWPGISFASRYQLEVTKDDAPFRNGVETPIPVFGPQFDSAGIYCVYVTALPADTATHSRSLKSEPPACVTVVDPRTEPPPDKIPLARPTPGGPRTGLVGGQVTIDWPDVPEAIRYRIRVDRDDSMLMTRTRSASRFVLGLDRSGVHCVYVTADPGAANDLRSRSRRSVPACVTVTDEPVPLARPLPAVRGTAELGQRVRFDWPEVRGAARYQLRLERGGDQIWEGSVTNSEYSRLMGGRGRFCLAVRAQPAAGEPGSSPSNWSPRACVTVIRPDEASFGPPACSSDEADLGRLRFTVQNNAGTARLYDLVVGPRRHQDLRVAAGASRAFVLRGIPNGTHTARVRNESSTVVATRANLTYDCPDDIDYGARYGITTPGRLSPAKIQSTLDLIAAELGLDSLVRPGVAQTLDVGDLTNAELGEVLLAPMPAAVERRQNEIFDSIGAGAMEDYRQRAHIELRIRNISYARYLELMAPIGFLTGTAVLREHGHDLSDGSTIVSLLISVPDGVNDLGHTIGYSGTIRGAKILAGLSVGISAITLGGPSDPSFPYAVANVGFGLAALAASGPLALVLGGIAILAGVFSLFGPQVPRITDPVNRVLNYLRDGDPSFDPREEVNLWRESLKRTARRLEARVEAECGRFRCDGATTAEGTANWAPQGTAWWFCDTDTFSRYRYAIVFETTQAPGSQSFERVYFAGGLVSQLNRNIRHLPYDRDGLDYVSGTSTLPQDIGTCS